MMVEVVAATASASLRAMENGNYLSCERHSRMHLNSKRRQRKVVDDFHALFGASMCVFGSEVEVVVQSVPSPAGFTYDEREQQRMLTQITWKQENRIQKNHFE